MSEGIKTVVYVTSSTYKEEENTCLQQHCNLKDGTPVAKCFKFKIKPLPIKEILDVDLSVMVQDEVVKAYSLTKVPCIVEHAGLIFKDYEQRSYPGGLTKPMWDTLQQDFIKETGSANRDAIARAVVAYCDGSSVKTFVGETKGKIADTPRGSRDFYWDTVFVPDDPQNKAVDMTYAEICENSAFGLEYKIKSLSQSAKAMLKFLEFLRAAPAPRLWS